MKPAEKIFDVEIAGIPLKLRTSNEEHVVSKLVNMVDSRVQVALKNSKNRSLQNAALVVALNIAEELLFCKEQARDEISRLGGEAQQLLADLESSQFSQAEIDH